MSIVLCLVHIEADGLLGRPALEAVAAAQSLGGELTVGVIGGSAAPQLAGCRVLSVVGDAFTVARYSTDAAAAEALCRAVSPEIILSPGTSRMARALPGVARRIGASIDTHIASIAPDLTATRWFYRQRMEATFSRPAKPWMLLLDGGVAPAYSASGPAAEVTALEVAVPATRTRVTGFHAPKSDVQTVRPEAEILFVAGAGWTKKQKDGQTHVPEAAEHILAFIETAQASLGSSKSLVDLSGEGQAVLPFLSHLNQVGQTGSTPRHPKGLATCCHGEEPHVVGWRFIKERRVVNLDVNCGWARGKADFVYIGDAFEVMTHVNRMLKAKMLTAAQ